MSSPPAGVPSPLGPNRPAADELALELVPRQCALQAYQRRPMPGPVMVSGRIIAYSSPDSTFAVTKRLLDGAKATIVVGTYDFNSRLIEQSLIDAAGRGVAVSVMLDVDNSGESDLLGRLSAAGVHTQAAPACGGAHPHYFPCCHEKITVIDDRWALVQSGNYTDNSIPPNGDGKPAADGFVPGNRDMGLAIESETLAAFFAQLVRDDMALAAEAPELEEEAEAIPEPLELFERAPQNTPDLRPARTFDVHGLAVIPVVSPENYVASVIALLQSAERSVVLEQQYIRPAQAEIRKLLDTLAAARHSRPGLRIRVILAPPFVSKDTPQLEAGLALLAQDYGLRLGPDIRLLNKKYFVHCHNKLVIVDGRRVLVGSQNWSDSAVSENREASLLVEHAGIADHFGSLFDYDWRTGVRSLAAPTVSLEEESGATVAIAAGDYAEV